MQTEQFMSFTFQEVRKKVKQDITVPLTSCSDNRLLPALMRIPAEIQFVKKINQCVFSGTRNDSCPASVGPEIPGPVVPRL